MDLFGAYLGARWRRNYKTLINRSEFKTDSILRILKNPKFNKLKKPT